jgi:hypothetical protein
MRLNALDALLYTLLFEFVESLVKLIHNIHL